MTSQNERQGTSVPARTAGPRTPWHLAGRDPEMALLRSAVTACAGGNSTVVEITGDPGLGKTRLLTELGALARSEGLTVLSGRASELERQRAFAAFAEPLRRCAGLLPEDARETPDEDTAALLDLLSHWAPGTVTGRSRFPGVERYRLYLAVARLLAGADRGHGVLLCLDDLHWADESTLEVLHHLLRQPPGTPLILACAHRPRQAPAKLRASFQHAAADYSTSRLPLAPLDRHACEKLLGPGHTPGRRERLCAVSGGNPLYLEVLAELSAQGAGDFADLPDTLRAALAREIALLTTGELAVLRAAAVLGDPFDPLLVAPVADLATPGALDALDVLAAKDLIRPVTPAGQRPDSRQLLQFRHPLLREVVSWETPPGWFLAANGRADRALWLSGAGPVERAPYVVRSAHPGDREAVGVLTEAAALTLRTTPAIAAAWLRTALRLSPPDRSVEPARRLGMLLGLANASGMTGDLAACREALLHALDLIPRDRPADRVPIVVLRSVVERILGSSRAAGLALEDEVARWPENDPRANPLRLQLATVRTAQGRYAEADEHLDALLARTPAPLDRRTRTAIAACRALGAAYSGRGPLLTSHAREASAALDVMDDQELTTFLDEAGQVGWAEALAERHGDAIRHMSRAVRVARRTGQTCMMAYLSLCQSYAQQAAGDLTGALTSAAHAEETAHLLGRPDLVGHALTLRATATALRDGPAAATPAAEHALSLVERRGRLWELATAALAALRLDQGRPDACMELLHTVIGAHDSDRSGRTATIQALRATWYCTAAQAETARGNNAAARVWAARATDAAETSGLPGQRGYAALARAAVHDDDPCACGAIEFRATAADRFAAAGLVLAEARARLALGRTLTAARRLEAATAATGRAKRLADACGAGYLGTLAVNAQRQIGARQPRPGQGPMGPTLSDQERRISALVARGLTNNAIAADLFISVKTVEGHLTRIFRKLHVTSRAGLAAVLAELFDAGAVPRLSSSP